MGLLQQALDHTFAFNTDMAISIGLLLLTCLIITPNAQKWKTIALPITIMWHVAGITPNYFQYVLTGLLWATNTVQLSSFGNPIQALGTLPEEIQFWKNKKKEEQEMQRAQEQATLQRNSAALMQAQKDAAYLASLEEKKEKQKIYR